MADEPTIMNRLIRAIADSDSDHLHDDSHIVDLSRKDALDAVKRIVDLHMRVIALEAMLRAAGFNDMQIKAGSAYIELMGT
jgi:hypothetical protein